MKSILYLLVLTSLNIAAQGFKFSTAEQLQEVDVYSFEEKGYADNLPSSYSLELYVPPIITQEGGTCVGFSSLYYGLSTTYNIINGYTSDIEKYANSFDPYFIYSILNNSNNDCEEGLIMSQAMEAVYEIGAKKMFYPQFLSCDSNWEEENYKATIPYTIPYKIKNYYFIEPFKVNFITNVKEALNNNWPVIVGVNTTKSLSNYSSNNLNGVSSNGLWSPKEYEELDGGHAMCVIGYDDNKYGGSFRLANSWGSDFGDAGFIWIKYGDFKKYTSEAYLIEVGDIENINDYERFVFKEPKYEGHVYEGQTLNGFIHGYGIYSFNDGVYIIGNFDHGSREGWFVYIDENEDEVVKLIKYKNDIVIDTYSSGFSNNEEDEEVEELRSYLNLISPKKNIIVVNQDLDLNISKKLD